MKAAQVLERFFVKFWGLHLAWHKPTQFPRAGQTGLCYPAETLLLVPATSIVDGCWMCVCVCVCQISRDDGISLQCFSTFAVCNLCKCHAMTLLIDLHAPVHKVQEGVLHLHLKLLQDALAGATEVKSMKSTIFKCHFPCQEEGLFP